MTTAVNTTTTANSTVNTGQASLTSDYNTFLQLLTTQLQNQDPLSPMDSNTFTQQLVQMNGVQQQLETNSLLQTLVNASSGSGPAVNLIGKSVTAVSPTASMANGSIDWTYNLASTAQAATVNVTDASGKVVWTQAAPSLASGPQSFNWDGSTLSGGKATSGAYTLSVVANDSNLKSISSSISVQGVVTGVSSSSSGTMLNLGSTQVNYSNVTQVQNASN